MATDVINPSKPDEKSLVAVKGTKHGLLFVLDDTCEFEALLTQLQDTLMGDQAAVFDGPPVTVSIDYGRRSLTPEQARTLLSLFFAKENFVVQEWGHQTVARQSLTKVRPRTPAQSIYKGIVRAGQRLIFDGDVVIVGDVNPGGEVVAAGDIYVFGKLSGIAHAGATGDTTAVIAAAEFAPMQLRIAGTVTRSPEDNGRPLHTYMEFAYLSEEGMAVDKTEYLPSFRMHRTT
ncbi:MAG: septum site-determining protein MinC [Alicyclobacillus sp.]|nr:septum site-determining protein MinC [Alicyclobacillus sp.]